MTVITIERKGDDVAAAARQLLVALRRTGVQRLTAADATVVSGLPLHLAEPALLQLASSIPSAKIGVDDTGNLVVTFERLSYRHDVRARLRALATTAWRRMGHPAAQWLSFVFMNLLVTSVVSAGAAHAAPETALHDMLQVATLLTVAPLLIFLMPVVLLALAPLMLVRSLADPPLSMALLRAGGYLGGMLALGGLYTVLARSAYRIVVRGRDLPAAIIGFFAGPTAPSPDVLADERELTGQIVAHDGVLCTLDLIELYGWTPADADAALVRILVDYGGDLEVTDDGAIVFSFASLSAQAAPREVDALEPIWMRPPPPETMFGCSPRFAAVIGGLSALGLGLALSRPGGIVVPSPTLYRESLTESTDMFGAILFDPGLGIGPWAVIGFVLGIRWVGWRIRVVRRRRQMARTAWVRQVAEHTAGAWLAPGQVDAGQVAAFGGHIDETRTREDGHVWVEFPDLESGRQAARARQTGSTRTPV